MQVLVEVIIVGGVGILLWRQINQVFIKLDKVLENQESQKVELAEIKKDVESNQEWGKSLKSQVETMQTQLAEARMILEGHKEYISNEKRKKE